MDLQKISLSSSLLTPCRCNHTAGPSTVQGCCKKKTTQKTTRVFFQKSPLKKTIKPTKKPTLLFVWKIYKVKNKSRTLVQLTINFFFIKQNEQQQIWRLEKKRNKSNSLSKFYWFSSSALHNRYILTNFSAFSAYKPFHILDHSQIICWKNTLQMLN